MSLRWASPRRGRDPEPAAARPREPELIEDDEFDRASSVPSPRDRLRHAFSSSIPENILDRSATAPSPPPRAPEPEPFPSAERDVYGTQAPVGLPVLRVVGVGGAGVNAVNRMVEAEIHGIEFLAINTDLQSLHQSAAHATLHIGAKVTRGLGSGSNPDLGRQAAMEEYDKIKALLKGADMVFVAAGAGGGTGTGRRRSSRASPASSARSPWASSPSRSASRARAAASRPRTGVERAGR